MHYVKDRQTVVFCASVFQAEEVAKLLEEVDEKGKVLIEDIVDYFIDFYEDRKSKGLKGEKKKCIYNNYVIDRENGSWDGVSRS